MWRYPVIIALLLALASSAFAADGDIVDVASKNGSFGTLVAAVGAAGLAETLQSEGPFTVFAPTDEAFAALPEGTVADLLKPENKGKLTAILTYHVVAGKVMAADVKPGAVPSVEGDTIDITIQDGKVMVDGATVVLADVKAPNGVIHVIDQVIMPEAKPVAAPPPPKVMNIVNVASGAGSFGTLLAAADAAGLVETLSGAGPLTVFAPTDEAFAALGATVDELLKPENKAKLASILTYHVVAGKVMAADLASGKVATVQGSDLKVKVKNGTVTLNKSATVVSADIDATNGVIHVIDAVLLP
ncbi:MAG: fasciclin domain-containing protein [Rhodobacterales bacterium]|nr:fasciclin domain-containing protein [Rhodobacterales bacterium]